MTVPKNDFFGCAGTIHKKYYNEPQGGKKARLNLFVTVKSDDGDKSMNYAWTIWEDVAESFSGVEENARIAIFGYAKPYLDKAGEPKLSYTANRLEVEGYTPKATAPTPEPQSVDDDNDDLGDTFL